MSQPSSRLTRTEEPESRSSTTSTDTCSSLWICRDPQPSAPPRAPGPTHPQKRWSCRPAPGDRLCHRPKVCRGASLVPPTRQHLLGLKKWPSLTRPGPQGQNRGCPHGWALASTPVHLPPLGNTHHLLPKPMSKPSPHPLVALGNGGGAGPPQAARWPLDSPSPWLLHPPPGAIPHSGVRGGERPG